MFHSPNAALGVYVYVCAHCERKQCEYFENCTAVEWGHRSGQGLVMSTRLNADCVRVAKHQ